MERLGRRFVSLWPVTDFPLSAHWLILPRVLKMKGGFQVRLTWTAFIWTVFVFSSLVGSPSGPFFNPWRGLRPSPCLGWKGIGRPAALIGVCTCRPQPWRRLGSGAALCVCVSVCVCVCVCAFDFLNEHWDTARFFWPESSGGDPSCSATFSALVERDPLFSPV